MSALRVRRSVLGNRRSMIELYTPAMHRLLFIAVLLARCAPRAPKEDVQPAAGAQSASQEILRPTDGAYKKLVELCDDVGHRLSGSKGLERAVEWGVATLKADGHEHVRAEPVKVPKWVRGKESLALVEPREYPMMLLGLGGSVGTPPEGITTEVVTVKDKAELDAIGDRARGKIVLFN